MSQLTHLNRSSKKKALKPASRPWRSDINKPRLDKAGRKLWWCKKVVNESPRPSICQETILAVFEKLNLPKSVDNPIPKSKEINPKRRLHYAIKRLNRHHAFQAISFHGNGNGQGIAQRRLRKAHSSGLGKQTACGFAERNGHTF